jgi:hypothetical protein
VSNAIYLGLDARRAVAWGVTWALGVAVLESLQLSPAVWSMKELVPWFTHWIAPLWCGASGAGVVLLLLVNRAERRRGWPVILAVYLAICPLAGLLQVPLAGALLSVWGSVPVSGSYGSPVRPWDAGGLYHTWIFMFYGAILIAAYLATIRSERTRSLLHGSKMARDRIEALLDAERLRVLQAQIDPTLLLGTMRELELRYRSDPAQAERLLEALVEFLRCAMNGLRIANSTFGAEIELARAFAALQRERGMTDGWRVSNDDSAALSAMPFPSLLMLRLLALSAAGGRPLLRVREQPDGVSLVLYGLRETVPADLRLQLETQLSVMYRSRFRLEYSSAEPSQLTLVLQRESTTQGDIYVQRSQ